VLRSWKVCAPGFGLAQPRPHDDRDTVITGAAPPSAGDPSRASSVPPATVSTANTAHPVRERTEKA
jgi:hypothetical protein